MKKEFLKEYNIITDIARLNNKLYFQKEFDTPQIYEHFATLNKKKESKGVLNTCIFFMENFVSMTGKDVYLVLKWLITVHRLIKRTKNPYFVEVICQNIGLIKEIPFSEKY